MMPSTCINAVHALSPRFLCVLFLQHVLQVHISSTTSAEVRTQWAVEGMEDGGMIVLTDTVAAAYVYILERQPPLLYDEVHVLIRNSLQLGACCGVEMNKSMLGSCQRRITVQISAR